MDIERIERVARAEMADSRSDTREPGWILYHGQRTGKLAVALAKELNRELDYDLLYTAGLFHDVGKGRERHNEAGARMATKLLSGIVTTSELEVICSVARFHNQRKKSNSYSDYIRLIQDADLIDHVGLIGVWTAFYWSGYHSETIHDHIAFYDGEEHRGFLKYMRNHLNFDASRQILEDRINLEEDFIGRFQKVYFHGM
jgi:uncharacterized protein